MIKKQEYLDYQSYKAYLQGSNHPQFDKKSKKKSLVNFDNKKNNDYKVHLTILNHVKSTQALSMRSPHNQDGVYNAHQQNR